MSDKVLRKLEAIVTSAVQSGLIPFNERLQLVHEQVQEVRDNLYNRRGFIGERQIAFLNLKTLCYLAVYFVKLQFQVEHFQDAWDKIRG